MVPIEGYGQGLHNHLAENRNDTVMDVYCWLALSIQPHLFQLPSIEVGKLKLMYLILSGNYGSGY